MRYVDPSGHTFSDAITGVGDSLRENCLPLFDSLAKEYGWISDSKYFVESKEDYYLGKAIGDVCSFLVGVGEDLLGISLSRKCLNAFRGGAKVSAIETLQPNEE